MHREELSEQCQDTVLKIVSSEIQVVIKMLLICIIFLLA